MAALLTVGCIALALFGCGRGPQVGDSPARSTTSAATEQGSTSGRGRLRITIQSIASADGQIAIAMFDNPAGFDSRTQPVRRTRLDARPGEMSWTVDNLPFGDYAIAVHHDEDGDGDLGRTGMGPPNEPYGFSNNARGRFGPPNFEAARFRFDRSGQEVVIAIR